MKEPIKDADMPNDKFIVAIISTETSVRELFTSALEEHPQVEALWTLSEYPAPSDLARINEIPNGCVVYLDFGDPLRARAIAAELDRKYQKAGTIAVHTNEHGTDLRDLMQLGVRELITAPFDRVEIQRAFERASRKLRKNSVQEEETASIFAFLPARPGSGATTIALHSAAAAARSGVRRRSLLSRFRSAFGNDVLSPEIARRAFHNGCAQLQQASGRYALGAAGVSSRSPGYSGLGAG